MQRPERIIRRLEFIFTLSSFLIKSPDVVYVATTGSYQKKSVKMSALDLIKIL